MFVELHICNWSVNCSANVAKIPSNYGERAIIFFIPQVNGVARKASGLVPEFEVLKRKTIPITKRWWRSKRASLPKKPQNSPVSVEKTLKLLSQKPAAMRNLESTVVTKQLLRAFTRWEKLSPSCLLARACAPPAPESRTEAIRFFCR